eukprot:Anaeramoba_ignava/a347316_22.p1 GENE.a347316_22~~a347316_22.p1  ORF type:complete len:460 (+),score=143.59 a347316_22:1220-2599(+)
MESIRKSQSQDVISENLKKNKKIEIPKSEWISHIMRKHPDVLSLREQLCSFTETKSFSKSHPMAYTESKYSLSHKFIMQLVMEFLFQKGYQRTISQLEEETQIPFKLKSKNEDRLKTMLLISLKSTQKIWEIEQTKQDDLSLDQDNEVVLNELLSFQDEKTNENIDSIWLEPENSDENILYVDQEKTILCAASINRLIQILTGVEKAKREFMRVFFMTYQTFMTPKELLKKLVERFHVPKIFQMDDEQFLSYKKIIQARVCQVLKFWLRNSYSDFDESLTQEFMKFINESLIQERYSSIAMKFRTMLSNYQHSHKHEDHSFEKYPEPKIPKNIFSRNLSIFDIDDEEIAKQMCLITSNHYTLIEPKELLNNSWNETSSQLKSQNVFSMIEFSKSITNWVVKTILSETENNVKLISKLIRISINLLNFSNYQDLSSILKGLKNQKVSELKCWDQIQKKIS